MHPRQLHLGLAAVAVAGIAKRPDCIRGIGIVPVDIGHRKDRPRSRIGGNARHHLPIVGFARYGEGYFGKYGIFIVENDLDPAGVGDGKRLGGHVQGGD